MFINVNKWIIYKKLIIIFIILKKRELQPFLGKKIRDITILEKPICSHIRKVLSIIYRKCKNNIKFY